MAVTFGKGGLQSTPGKNPFKKKKEEVNKPFKPQQPTETTQLENGKVVSKSFAEQPNRVYPTINPDFKPDPNAIEVLPNGGEIRKVGGKTITLTPAEVGSLYLHQSEGSPATRETTPTEKTQAIINERLNPTPEQPPFMKPLPLRPDIEPKTMGALGGLGLTSATLGGSATGAKAGAVVGSLFGPAGTAIGAGTGAVVGAGAGAFSYYYLSQSSARKNQVKTSIGQFSDATKNMQAVINDANAQTLSKQQLRENWDSEYARVQQAKREIEAQQDAMFGETLSRSMDDLGRIYDWERKYQTYEYEFESSMAMPDKTKIISDIAVQNPEETQTETTLPTI